MKSYLLEPETILRQTEEVYLRGKGTETGPFRILKWEVYRNSIFLDIDGIDDVKKADPLRGVHVLIPFDRLESLAEGEYYWHELMGMTVMTEDEEVLGTLTSIFPTGSNDVYVCTGEKGEMLIPAICDVVLQIDKTRRVMIIRFLEGMDRPC